MGRQPATAINQQGFTLLELIATLLIMALAVALAAPVIGRSSETIRVRADVARFSAIMRHARQQAIATRQPHSVVVDPVAHRVAIMTGEDEVREARALPPELVLEADPPAALTVRFESQGVSNGGSFRLASGNTRYRVQVDALTGRVKANRE